jgi:DNA end-binding protein Ku
MAARSSWKGFIKLSLVSIPVKAYTAHVSGGGDIKLNQLHAECKSRINYRKTCPIHGEVKADEIVSGYEFSKDQYVLIDTDELDKLRTEDDKGIKMNLFVSPTAIDPIYYSERSYYLVPDGPIGQKPYTLICEAMEQEKRYALAQVVLSGKEQLVLLRPMEGLLVMTVLSLDAEISKPGAFKDEAPPADFTKEEMTLAKTLIKASSTDKLDYAQYKDEYTEKLKQLIQAKVEGKELVAPPSSTGPQVINIMDALRESVAKAQKVVGVKPPKKMAPSKKPAAASIKKKKKQA